MFLTKPTFLRTTAVMLLLALLLVSARTGEAQSGDAPADVRARLEGTWVLEEWHHEGQVLRPPQVGGRWMNHDGVVMATFHRQSHGSFESFAGYGTYAMDASTWSYGYTRIERARGTSQADAVVTVEEDRPTRSYALDREGDTIVLTTGNDRREYDDRFFTYMIDGSVLRKYRKVR